MGVGSYSEGAREERRLGDEIRVETRFPSRLNAAIAISAAIRSLRLLQEFGASLEEVFVDRSF